jgi:hypothetical protein
VYLFELTEIFDAEAPDLIRATFGLGDFQTHLEAAYTL